MQNHIGASNIFQTIQGQAHGFFDTFLLFFQKYDNYSIVFEKKFKKISLNMSNKMIKI